MISSVIKFKQDLKKNEKQSDRVLNKYKFNIISPCIMYSMYALFTFVVLHSLHREKFLPHYLITSTIKLLMLD